MPQDQEALICSDD